MIDPDDPAYPIITDFVAHASDCSVYHGDIIPEFPLQAKVS